MDVSQTVLPPLAAFLERRGRGADGPALLTAWFSLRSQEIFAEAAIGTPRTPFVELTRRSLASALHARGVSFEEAELGPLVEAWNTTVPFPEVPAALAKLAAGRRLALLTNVDRALLPQVAGALAPSFTALLSSEDAGTYKPSPRVFAMAAERLGARPEEVLHVAAAASEIAGAGAAGLWTALVNRQRLRVELLARAPDLVVDGLDGLLPALSRQGA